MFWKLSFRQPSAIDTLLDKEDCTLSEILDEDDVLQECKTQNKKLVDFLARPEILEQLVGMISREPENDVEDKVKFKYPHIACELLTSEVFTIVEELSGNEHLIKLLWAFLESSVSLNPLVGSFISKVLAMLLNQKASVIYDYIRGREGFLVQFLSHLGTSAMMDLLLQMVAAPDNDQSRLDLAMWLKEQGIVDKLVDFIKPSADPDQCMNASQALCDMIRLSREAAQMASPTPLLGTLESDETMQRLLNNMFCTDTPSDVAVVNGVAVLLAALERRPPNMFSPALNRSFGQTEDITSGGNDITYGVDQVLSVIVPRVEDFHDLLKRRPNMPPMVTTIGVLDPPLGNTRLQVVRLFSALLQCNNKNVAKEIVRLKTFCVLMDLFFEYTWNNFLHTQVECCVNTALASTLLLNGDSEQVEQHEEGQQDNPSSLRHHFMGDLEHSTATFASPTIIPHKRNGEILTQLLTECQLVHKLLQGAEKSEELSSQPGGHRQGYMGHMLRIVNALAKVGETDEHLSESMKQALDEETQQKWNSFLGGAVAEMNKKNETNLGGNRPLTSSMDDSDEEFGECGPGPDSELDKAYQLYQDAKYISNFMDDYGVEDELNAMEEPFGATFTRLMDITCSVSADEDQSQSSALFESACSERIQQFDDSESDEEESSTWADKDVTFVSPGDQQSGSSDDDEFDRRPRELQTGSSDDEEQQSNKRAAMYVTTSPNTLTKITSTTTKKDHEPDKMEIDNAFGVISWRSDLSSDEDLSGVMAMDTGAGFTDWTQEPDPGTTTNSSPSSNWADFSKFPVTTANTKRKEEEDDLTPQDMELETSLESPEIIVGYDNSKKEDEPKRQQNMDDVNESPERHDTSKYKLFSPGSSSEGEPDSPLSVDHIHVRVGHDSESSEEENASSDSDEERAGTYRLSDSTSSENDLLLVTSPAQPFHQSRDEDALAPLEHGRTEQQQLENYAESAPKEGNDKSSTPNEHETPSNGVRELSNHRQEDHKDEPRSKLDTEGQNVENNSSQSRVGENSEQLQDGELDEHKLHDNYSFLQRGLLSESAPRRKGDLSDEQQLVEEKRAEALEVCAMYEKEVQGSQEEIES